MPGRVSSATGGLFISIGSSFIGLNPMIIVERMRVLIQCPLSPEIMVGNGFLAAAGFLWELNYL
jgi:hypothetical protein